jgi:hypothetical protein
MASYEMGKAAMRYYKGDTGVTSAANTFRRGWEIQKTAGNITEGARDLYYTVSSPMALKDGLASKAKQFGTFVKDKYTYKTLGYKNKITLLNIKKTLEAKKGVNLKALAEYKNLLARSTKPSDRVKYNSQIRYYEDIIAKENLLLEKIKAKLVFNFPESVGKKESDV